MNQTETMEQEVSPEGKPKIEGGPGGSLPSLWLLPTPQEKLQDRHVGLTDPCPF